MERAPFACIPKAWIFGFPRSVEIIRVGMALWTYADGRETFVSFDTLASSLGMDKRNVQRAIRWFRKNGWIEVHKKRGIKSNYYLLIEYPQLASRGTLLREKKGVPVVVPGDASSESGGTPYQNTIREIRSLRESKETTRGRDAVLQKQMQALAQCGRTLKALGGLGPLGVSKNGKV